MDEIETLLTRILTRIAESSLSDDAKNDLNTRLEVGLHSLVWPILLSHIAKSKLDEIILANDQLTVEQYSQLIKIALEDTSSMKELHAEIKGALKEVQSLIEKNLPKPQPAVS